MQALSPFWELGVALALGFLIGLERGWDRRTAEEGQRVAGIRTFSLVGLLGGLVGVLQALVGSVGLIAATFASLAALLLAAYTLRSLRSDDHGLTTFIAVLVTFVLGVLAASGQAAVALAGAVVTGLLLGAKPVLHDALTRISGEEVRAIFKLLLISAVALPLIPDRGFGPGGVVNPFEIWWLVVLIAALSSAGYFAMRAAGPSRGLLVTGALGGLASSTALTLTLARLGRRSPTLTPVLAAATMLGCAMMFPRVWLEAVLVEPALALRILVPLVAMAAALGIAAWLLNRRPAPPHRDATEQPVAIGNPFELRTALQFGVLLTAVMLLSHLGQEYFGDRGVFLVAVIASLSDVDAITLTMARTAGTDVTLETAGDVIVLSAAINTLAKGALAAAIGGRAMWRPVMFPLACAAAVGIVAVVGL